jgi:hypothetical protein
MKDIVWNKIMLREFRQLACLSRSEEIVLKDWAYGESIVTTAMQYHMSERTVKDIRKVLRDKYDAVQKYTPLLPERK